MNIRAGGRKSLERLDSSSKYTLKHKSNQMSSLMNNVIHRKCAQCAMCLFKSFINPSSSHQVKELHHAKSRTLRYQCHKVSSKACHCNLRNCNYQSLTMAELLTELHVLLQI